MGQAVAVDLRNNFANFFENELLSEADLVLKLGYAYSLNLQSALVCVRQVFSGLIKDLPELVKMDFDSIRVRLFSECLEVASKQSQSKRDPDSLTSFLAELSLEHRLVLVMNELAGFSAKECALVLKKSELDIRKCLYQIRQKLVNF